MNARHLTLAAAVAVAAACDRSASPPANAQADSTVAVAQDSNNRAPGPLVIDTLLPIAEQVRRFSEAIGGTPLTALVNASPSRDSLLHRFTRALEQRDTTAFRQMIVNAREFIDLVYPESPLMRRSYPPLVIWTGIMSTTGAGFSRLLETRGGKPLGAVGMTCADKANREGKNLIWNECLVRIREPNGTERREQLFGSIIERDGKFKFLNYVNKL